MVADVADVQEWFGPRPGSFSGLPTSTPTPWWSIGLCACWLLPVLVFWLLDYFARQRRRIVRDPGAPIKSAEGESKELKEQKEPQEQEAVPANDFVVLLASLEHSLPHRREARAVAGGLGKVVDLIARHHPTNLIMVHPMLSQGLGQANYGEPDAEDPPLQLKVDGHKEVVRVFRQRAPLLGDLGQEVDFLLLSHPLFEVRTKQTIYPNPMTRRAVLRFFSLWNQAVGALLARHKPAVYHCPDFHTALAPWYALPEHPKLRVLLVLHNAEYQGMISTDMIRGEKLKALATILNLPQATVQRHMVSDGRFNMLKAAVSFIEEFQGGRGVCAVSRWYAEEVLATYSLFWHVKGIQGLDNPMLEEERPTLDGTLEECKVRAKKEIQEHFGLNQDPKARLFVSLGRLVRQKGVDLLADIAPWLLSTFPDSQLILIGPIGDGFGHYAAAKLQAMADAPEFRGRLFVKCEFLRVPESLKLAADFCLMPSRDEPFGYVDVEFAWCGSVLVGAQAGGLGKVPGFYYMAQNRENLGRLRRELRTAVTAAMRAPPEQLQAMARAALLCEFPLGDWQRKLLSLYGEVLTTAPADACAAVPSKSRSRKDEVFQLETLEEGMATVAPAAACFGRSLGAEEARDVIQSSPPTHSIMSTSTLSRARTVEDIGRPVSMLDVFAAEDESADLSGGRSRIRSFLASATLSDLGGTTEEDEFLKQELDEEQLAGRVSEKVRAHPNMGIDEVLESVGADVDREQEASRWGAWLLEPTLGVLRIHWVIVLGFVVSPVAEVLVFVMATEWGTRSTHMGEGVPQWVGTILPPLAEYAKLGGELDPMVLSMLFMFFNSLAFAVGAPFWASLCHRFAPRTLMACGILLQLPIVLTVVPVVPRLWLGLVAVSLHGFITSCSTLFLVFNFMMSIKADMSQYAVRMGFLQLLGNVVTWFLTGYIFLASPTSVPGSPRGPDDPVPSQLTVLLWPIALLLLVLSLVPGLLCLSAPGPYREDRFPGWDLGLLLKKKAYLILALSECVGSLALFPSACYVRWWLANGWTGHDMVGLSAAFGALLCVGIALWAFSLSATSKHGYSVLIGAAVLLAPAALLRALVQEEVATPASLGRSELAIAIVVVSLLFDGIRSSAMWTAKIRILNSRWRLLSYATMEQTLTHVCACLSPFLSEALARRAGTTFLTRNQKELADAVLACVSPICLLQFVVQVLATPFIYKDMGVSVATERDPQGRVGCRRWFKRLIPVGAIVLSVGAASLYVPLATFLEHRDQAAHPMHRCYVTEQPRCTVLRDVEDGLPALHGEHFGLNRYGQNTTGRHNCRLAMRAAGGNSFVFWGQGRCQVLSCGSTAQLGMPAPDQRRPPSSSPWGEAEVWSHFCEQPGQNVMAVHLFEWRWQDIADECEQYLGPAGISAVQVSPPQEHVLGSSWVTRYQPVSYKLESRSGTRADFVDMVRRCRQVGVNVMVDAVINHMASPYLLAPKEDKNKQCGSDKNTNKTTTRKCEGWDGTEFGNRQFLNNEEGLDRFDRKHFHHYQENDQSNCGLPPDANDKRVCDLQSLPDLNTEMPEVQEMIARYLFDLYEIGVTHLRIDAAMHLYTDSMARILDNAPWDYVVQEYYPVFLENQVVKREASRIGSLTDFSFGPRVAQSFFDAGGDGKPWTDRTKHFEELLKLGPRSFDGCEYEVCGSPYEPEHALIFLDNHDSQRERWKNATDPDAEKVGPEALGVCSWNGVGIGICRPIYKHGRQYLVALSFMLTWGYGDAARIMSSFAWQTFQQGPPGVRPDSLRDTASAVRCKDTPTTSPVTAAYDRDESAPWVCEHRWRGVLAMARFRRLVGREPVTFTWTDGEGHLAFGRGKVGFVALSRGWNYETGSGSNATLDLAAIRPKLVLALPAGTYCNLAEHVGPLAGPQEWDGRCSGAAVVVNADGTIARGALVSASAVVLHANYTSRTPFGP